MARKMHSPLQIVGVGIAAPAGAVRLPPGEWIQIVHFGPGGGAIRYRYGGLVGPMLYPATVGLTAPIVHPGTEVFIELFAPVGEIAFVHITGSLHPDPNEQGYDV